MLKKAAQVLSLAFVAVALDFGARLAFAPRSPLPQDDRALGEKIFGDQVDFSRVGKTSWKPSIFASEGKPMVIGNTIFLARAVRTDTMHELTHVWQNQNNIPGTGVTGVLTLWFRQRYQDAYTYKADATKNLTDYNMEQQGNMMADYYALELYKPATLALGEGRALKVIVERQFPHLIKMR